MKKFYKEQEQKLTKLQIIGQDTFEALGTFFAEHPDAADWDSKFNAKIADLRFQHNELFPEKPIEPEGFIKVTDIKFLHMVKACMSFGLYVDDSGNGYICSSAAARVGSPTSFQTSSNVRTLDTYSRKISRTNIIDRLNHYFGNLEQRNYTPCKVCPIGKVTNVISTHKRMIEIVNKLLGCSKIINRKEFVLASLSLINESLIGDLDPTNEELVADAITEIYTEFSILKSLDQQVDEVACQPSFQTQ